MRDWLGRWRRRTRVRCCRDGEVGVVTGKEKRGEEEAHWLVYVSLWCPVFCAKLCQYAVWHQADLYQQSDGTKIQ